METFLSYLPFALIVCSGIFIQAAAGFAAGLIIVPALFWYGYPIPEAQAALLVATIPQNVWGFWSFRKSVPLDRIVWPGIARIVFFPVGVWILLSMESLDRSILGQIVSGFMLAATLATILIRPKPQQRLAPFWGWLTFPLSGLIQGCVGMGGPLMVLWVQAHDWSTKQTRGFLFAMYLVSMVPALLVLYGFFGERIFAACLHSAATIPLLIISTHYGLKAGTKLGRQRLRWITLALLLVIGITGLAGPWLSSLTWIR
jgi:uncharacterized protein